MAKAAFHKSQRVFVKPVGTHAVIERVIPHWAKGVEEPIRVTYDVGLQREFLGSELETERTSVSKPANAAAYSESLHESWQIQRQINRVLNEAESAHHPEPGTFPVVTTDENQWGGWRVPCAEYNRDPERIEHQARMIVNAPEMVRLCRSLVDQMRKNPDAFPKETRAMIQDLSTIIRHVYGVSEKRVIAAE